MRWLGERNRPNPRSCWALPIDQPGLKSAKSRLNICNQRIKDEQFRGLASFAPPWALGLAFSKPDLGTFSLPAGNRLDPAEIGPSGASMGCIWPRMATFCHDGALFAAERPPRKPRYFHSLADELRALASPSTLTRTPPL